MNAYSHKRTQRLCAKPIVNSLIRGLRENEQLGAFLAQDQQIQNSNITKDTFLTVLDYLCSSTNE